ncbi:MAG: pseudouridine synthase, partial [Christensenellaceae bacterium]
SGINGEIRPGIVHRLDKDTSGLLVIAKNDAAHKNLSEQIAQKRASRVYRAIVFGNVQKDEGTISTFIDRDPRDR